MADESCYGCNVTEDCWWLNCYEQVMGCPCQDCLIKIICEELCENAGHFISSPIFREKDKDL